MLDGWKSRAVGEICKRVSVGIVIKPSQYYVEGSQGIRAFRSANIAENRIVDENWVYLSPEGHKANSKSCLRAGDVLVVRSGAPGTACVVTEEYEGSNCIDVVFARPDRSEVLPEFLSEYTNSAVGKQHVLGNKGGLALQHFNVGAYKEMIVLLPPLAEQRKIAEILRTWDEAIEKLEALRVAKLHRYRALTHALVFGARQLQRFQTTDAVSQHRWFTLPGTWASEPIGRLASEISERNIEKKPHEVLSCSKYDGFVRSLEYFKKQVFSADLSGYKKIWRGDFGFPSNHVEEGSIGLQNLADLGLVSPIYTVFRFAPAKVDADFAHAVLKTRLYRHIFEVSTSASVDRRGSLRWSEFSKLPFPVPPMDEQRAIADVLRTFRTDLDAVAAEIDVLTRQKRGLMQKLLTGQWRVKPEGADA